MQGDRRVKSLSIKIQVMDTGHYVPAVLFTMLYKEVLTSKLTFWISLPWRIYINSVHIKIKLSLNMFISDYSYTNPASQPVISQSKIKFFKIAHKHSHLISRKTMSVSGLLQQCSVHKSTVTWLTSLGSQGMYLPASRPPLRIVSWWIVCLTQKEASFARMIKGTETKNSR